MRYKEGPWYAYLREYAQGLGWLKGSLLGLEFVLRVFLFDAAGCSQFPRLLTFEVGDWVREDPVTNYDKLRQLIEKYNGRVEKSARELCIDKKALVDLRDALAHGRLLAADAAGPFQLLKFSDSTGGMVEVQFSETMTNKWLQEQAEFADQAARKVQEARKRLKEGELK